jgi:hypothetical protein
LPGNGNSRPVSTDVTLTCEESTDQDIHLWCSEDGYLHVGSSIGDPVTHTWSGAVAGQGTTINWTTPATAGAQTITVTADDSPIADDAPVQDSVDVQIVNVQVDIFPKNIAACAGCVNFWATTDPPGYEEFVSWDWDGIHGEPERGQQIYIVWSQTGTKTVTATCGDSSASTEVTIVDVASVASDKEAACVDCLVNFTVITNPAGYEYLVSWAASGGATGGGKDWATNWNTPGTKTVTASCGDSNASKNVDIVEVASVTTVPEGVTSACASCDVTFKVTTNPPGHEDLISWSGGGNPAAQNGGETFTTKWDTVGQKTVTATCGTGTSSRSTQVDIIPP